MHKHHTPHKLFAGILGRFRYILGTVFACMLFAGCLDIPDKPLPAAAEARMDALRTALSQRGAVLSRRALNDAWRFCALMLKALGDSADPIAVLDRAVAQRLLPVLLATAPAAALAALPALLEGLPMSRELLRQPMPVLL